MRIDIVLATLFIFIFYSFLGWVLEVITVAIKENRFVNRGITSGPLCPIYGLSALIIILATTDTDNIPLIFIASLIYGTSIEFITGKILEKVNKNKWWDYSKKKFNVDGYICLEYSILWGILGVLVVKLINPILLSTFNDINLYIRCIVIFILTGIIIVDLLSSFITIKYIRKSALEDASNKIGNYILESTRKRIENAYPNIKRHKKIKSDSKVFAHGTSFYKLFWVFLIGATVGDLCEIVYCRFSMHRWMSRSSLLFGQLSVVWGAAMVLATISLHKYKDKSNSLIFIIGSIMGGAFEYICSVFTEFFFGTIFWDYSKIPFNLNGRINLLFCFFWGFASVLFIKKLYPFISNIIERIPKKFGTILTNILFILLIIDLFMTSCVMMRYNERRQGIEASNVIAELCDKYADDEFMHKRWSNMKNVIKE